MPPSPAPHESFLLLIRHGATANNVASPVRLQGCRSDPELSPEGRDQATQAACCLAAFPLAAVYSSPLTRARQTAEAIALPHQLPVIVETAITECDVGRWEGRDWEEIERNDPDAYRRFMDDPAENPYPEGESLWQVSERVSPALERIASRHMGQQVVVVAHNVVNRVVLAPLLGVPMPKARGIQQANCGVNLLRYRDNQWKLLTVNSVLHLEEW